MKASVRKIDTESQVYTIVTDTNLAIVFKLLDNTAISLGDELQVELKDESNKSNIKDLRTGQEIKAQIKSNNIHNLTKKALHGKSRNVH